MASSISGASFMTLSVPPLTTMANERVKLGTSFVPKSSVRGKGFSMASLKWKMERRREGKMSVRCEAAAVAEKEAEDASGEKFEYQAEVCFSSVCSLFLS